MLLYLRLVVVLKYGSVTEMVTSRNVYIKDTVMKIFS